MGFWGVGADVREMLIETGGKDVEQLQAQEGLQLVAVARESGTQVALEVGDTAGATSGWYIRVSGVPANMAKAIAMLRTMVRFHTPPAPAPSHPACTGLVSEPEVVILDDPEPPEEPGGVATSDPYMFASLLDGAEGPAAEAAAEEPEPEKNEDEGVKDNVQPLLLALGVQEAGKGINNMLELGIVALCPLSGEEVGRFHRLSQPSNGASNDGSLQEKEASAMPFAEVLADLLDWIPALLGKQLDSLQQEDFLFVTKQDSDIETILPRQCSRGAVDSVVQNFFFCHWACLRDAFMSHFALAPEVAPGHPLLMLRHLGLPFQACGAERRCMHAADELARISRELLRLGWEPKATARRASADSPAEYFLRSARACPGDDALSDADSKASGAVVHGGIANSKASSQHGGIANSKAAVQPQRSTPKLAMAPTKPGTAAALASAKAASLRANAMGPPPLPLPLPPPKAKPISSLKLVPHVAGAKAQAAGAKVKRAPPCAVLPPSKRPRDGEPLPELVNTRSKWGGPHPSSAPGPDTVTGSLACLNAHY